MQPRPLDELCVKPTVRRAFTLQTTLALLNLSLAKCWFCKWEEAKAGSRVSSPDWNVPAAHSLVLEWHLICRTASDWTVTDYICLLQVSERWKKGRGDKANPALQAVASHPKIAYIPPSRRLTPDLVHQRRYYLFLSLSTQKAAPPAAEIEIPHQCG